MKRQAEMNGLQETEEEEEQEEEEEEEEEEDPREVVRKENLGECFSIVLFLLFLFIFSLGVLLEQSAASSQLADHIRQKLDSGSMSLSTISSVPTLYDYLEKVLVPEMFENSTDTQLAARQSSYLHAIDVCNRVLGPIRLRQVRVALKQGCEVTPMFSQYSISCYPPLSDDTEQTSIFGNDNQFVYSKDENGEAYGGSLASYGPNGYMQLLPDNRTEALMLLRTLRTEGFMGAATRAVFVDFAVWNSNVGVYAVTTIVVEFGASGGVKQQLDVLTMTEANLVAGGLGTASDWVAFIAMIIVMLFVLWYMSEEYSEIKEKRFEYLLDGWNVLDWTNMIILIVAFIIRILLLIEAKDAKVGQKALANKEIFFNLRPLASKADLVKLLYAFNAVLLWGKVVKYLRKLPLVKNLIRTVWSSFELFLPFLFMFSLALIGFAMAYNIGFGDKIWELSTFTKAVIYLCRAFIRNVELMPVYEITPLFGAGLILLFYVTLVLVGVNVLFAILADAIIRSKYEGRKVPGDDDEEDLHEDEPLEEFLRSVQSLAERVVKRWLPWTYRVLARRSLRDEMEIPLDAAPEGAGEEGEDEDGGGSQWRRQQALEDGSSSQRSGYEEDEDVVKRKPLTRQELIRAIELMSGRLLSEVSIVGIEIKSELHDVCERVAQMQMAVEELSYRADQALELPEEVDLGGSR